jgi:hypothetical protein
MANVPRLPKNWIPFSEDFSIWTAANVVATDNNIVGPDGRTVGALLTAAGAGNQRIEKQDIINPGHYEVIFSAFLQEGTLDNADLTLWDVDSAAFITSRIRFDVNAGVIDTVVAGAGRISGPFGNWYFCEAYNTALPASPFGEIQPWVFVSPNGPWPAGTIYIANAQLNDGIIADPYSTNTEVART